MNKLKKINIIIMLTLIFGIPNIVSATPANSAFTDDNFYECVVDAYNKRNGTSLDYSTNLTDTQLQTITMLSCTGYSKQNSEKISNMDGIEKLVNLNSLSISETRLTELDVSKNVNLIRLVVSANQLTELDVSKNVNLIGLSVAETQLTELDVSQNIKLRELSVRQKQLTELDVSKNVNLEYLSVYNNQLTELDVSKNVNLIKLSVAENQLTELDVSKNVNLAELSVAENQLTELDVSKNTLLDYLDIHDNPFESNVGVYINETRNLSNNNVVKLLENTIITLTKVTSESQNIVIDNELVSSNISGVYDISAEYTHNMMSAYNFSVTNKLHVIELISDKYLINAEDGYIYTGQDIDSNIIKANVSLNYGEVEIENNKLLVKYNGELIKTFDIINISSKKYEVNTLKGYVYIGISNFNVSNINITNGNISVETNKLLIKYNDKIVETFDIVKVESDKYYLTDKYIYISNDTFDIAKVDVINGSKGLVNNKLEVNYKGVVLENFEFLSICFGNLEIEGKRIIINKNITYDDFINNITPTGVTYKIYNEESVVTNGNISNGMMLKVYNGDSVIDTYSITDEYLEFDSSLNVDEDNKMIKKISVNTKVSDIKKKISTSGDITILDKNNKELSDTDILGTGYKVKIELSSETHEYVLSVIGDVTGDGKITVTDVGKLYQFYKGRIDMENYYQEAGNVVSKDNQIKLTDVGKLYQFIKCRIDSLED